MKNFKKIEGPKMDLNPEHRMSPESMSQIVGGGGCICNEKRFRIFGNCDNTKPLCICNSKKFGFCSGVGATYPTPYL